MEAKSIDTLHINLISMMNIWRNILNLYNRQDYDIMTTDSITGEKISMMDLIGELTQRIVVLEQKYEGALQDIKNLEEENIENSNLIYELMNSMDAIDARIDIVVGEKFLEYHKDV